MFGYLWRLLWGRGGHGITLEWDDETQASFEEMKGLLNTDEEAEVITYSLAVTELLVKAANTGGEVIVRYPDGTEDRVKTVWE